VSTRSICLLHENAGAHTARATQQLLQEFQLGNFRPSRSQPRTRSSDFHLFLRLKKHLAGQKFHEDEEVKNKVPTWLCALAAEFYNIIIQKLIPRQNKSRDKRDDYVGKYIQVCVKSFFNLFC